MLSQTDKLWLKFALAAFLLGIVLAWTVDQFMQQVRTREQIAKNIQWAENC